MVDLLDYLRGDGRLYELVNNQGTAEVCQTQTESNDVFYHVKNSAWEELWADDFYIYRGTDTSAPTEVYTLSEDNHYGSTWVPRHFNVGDIYRRSPTVTWRRKSDGQLVASKPPGQHVTYIKFVKLHDTLTFQVGLQLSGIVELHAILDAGGQPATTPWEKYFYAKGYGLVAFEDMLGGFRSWIAQKFTPEQMPQRVREKLPWLAALQQRYRLPALPPTTPVGKYILTELPSDWVNVRDYPRLTGRDIGDLRKGDTVMLHTPEVDGWVYIQMENLSGWVSRQNGKVVFTASTTPPPDPGDDDPIPHDDSPPPVQWPSSLEEAIQMRDYFQQVEENAHQIRVVLDGIITQMGG